MQKYKKIDIVTLGCAKNIVDSEHIAGALKAGYKVVFDDESFDADVVIINTCGFILDAKTESIDMILSAAEAKKSGQIKALYVIGCLSERYADDLRAEIEEVDKYFGARDFLAILQELNVESSSARVLTTPPHYAYLKIGEGCNWGCGYCAIPLIRGPHRSVPMEEILSEAKILAAGGVKELIVIAQDTTYYGKDIYGQRKLGDLLRKLCKIDGIEWIRVQYAYPADFPADVIDVIASEPKICSYLDIPFQHISDRVLTNMRRRIGKSETLALIEQLQRAGIVLRTTLLVGYPGETEQDFAELLEFVETVKFDRLGVFPYSAEEGTYSVEKFIDDVAQDVKQARAQAVMTLQEGISEAKNAQKVGHTFTVLIDRLEGDFYVGRTEFDSPEVDCEVLIKADRVLKTGQFVKVEIKSADAFDIYGQLL